MKALISEFRIPGAFDYVLWQPTLIAGISEIRFHVSHSHLLQCFSRRFSYRFIITALSTEMQENMWARLRESHKRQGSSHAT